jgi:hypothetical protein
MLKTVNHLTTKVQTISILLHSPQRVLVLQRELTTCIQYIVIIFGSFGYMLFFFHILAPSVANETNAE